MNRAQEQRLDEYLEQIKHNVADIANAGHAQNTLYMNLLSRGQKIFMNKNISTQDVIDISSILLTLELKSPTS